MSDFSKFALAVHARFTELSKHELFTVDIAKGAKKEDGNPKSDGDVLWEAYLAAFPAGTNPIFRERSEHDCSMCRNFVKNLGNAVAIVDGKPLTVWQLDGLDDTYSQVAAILDNDVRKSPINGLFRKNERKYGAHFTVEAIEGVTKRWYHFHGDVVNKHFTKEVDAVRGKYASTVGVFQRGLNELRLSDMDTVIDLIKSNNLYRGEEFLASVEAFRKLKVKYDKFTTMAARDMFAWANGEDRSAGFRNTMIGTLLQDLAKEVPLEDAVRMYESKAAPANYKRPKALVTPGMVKEAMKTIKELDLEDALARRFARITDVNINNVLWADSEAKSHMKGGIEDLLTKSMALPAIKVDGAEDIQVADFMAKILPKVTAMDVFVKNSMASQFVTLTAPVHTDVYKLFKWDNEFAWSYQGGVADSIKERVKKAGGNVTNAKLRVSLAWFNADDLDIHVFTPDGKHIYYGDKLGCLDVDTNGRDGMNAIDPVENVSFTSLKDGEYGVVINQYNKRSTQNIGFELEVEEGGRLYNYSHPADLRNQEKIDVLKILVKSGAVVGINKSSKIEGRSMSQEIWNVTTEQFVKVSTLMLSPNYWDGNAVGNRHWFFMLDGCKTDEPQRGIYNEFLNGRLEKHRRVFELLGDKTKIEPAAEQLSGIGFSSTRQDQVLVRVAGQKSRKLYNVIF